MLLRGILTAVLAAAATQASGQADKAYKLIWSDEFNKDGKVDTAVWRYEKGFERNHEAQWYQEDNAWCENGFLIIEARKAHQPNPRYDSTRKDWRSARPFIEYTSSSINTRGKKAWQYGRFEVRAKIDTTLGLWPAFWTLGVKKEWPGNGEIDIMEYYRGDILANVATGTDTRYKAKWFTFKKPVGSFPDKDWSSKFHIWRMDWDEEAIRLYVDDLLLNEVFLKDLANPDGFNPFKQPHYILLNLAMGGDNGGDMSRVKFPNRYVVDYVRVYQR